MFDQLFLLGYAPPHTVFLGHLDFPGPVPTQTGCYAPAPRKPPKALPVVESRRHTHHPIRSAQPRGEPGRHHLEGIAHCLDNRSRPGGLLCPL